MVNDGFPKVELGSICSKIGSGATPRGGSEVYLDKGEITLIRSQNIYNNGFNREGLVYITEEHADQLSNVKVEQEDVLLNITGDSVARCCQVNPRVLPARVNQHVAIIRPNPKELNPQFLRYFLVSPAMQAQMLSWAHAGATRKALTKGMIESFKVPKPGLAIQQAIAHILGSLDDKIELNRQMNRTLEGMAQAIFKSWFVDFDPVRAKAEGRDPGLPKKIADLFPDSFEDSELGEIPKGWKVKQIGDVLELAYGKSLPKEKRGKGKIPVYGSGGIGGYHSEYLVKGPGIIVGRKGTVGSVYWEEDNFFPIDTVFYVALKGSTPLYWVFRRLSLMDIQRLGADSAVPGVNRNTVHTQRWVIPTDNVAEKFQDLSDGLREQAKKNRKDTEVLSNLRDTLLPKLLSGEIELPAAESIAEEVV